jgi:ATP-dependent 26S proteasome regulatory subunit
MMALGGGMVGPASSFMVSHMIEGDVDDNEAAEQAWRLLVLEDTGELLTPDAKSVIGQGLSRFLNVVDGLIGQGLRVLVLVTTNEEIKSLHPAVARPGRAAANVDFVPLSSAEASAWLRERGVGESTNSRTIASLYAQLDGRDPGESVPSVGFGEPG